MHVHPENPTIRAPISGYLSGCTCQMAELFFGEKVMSFAKGHYVSEEIRQKISKANTKPLQTIETEMGCKIVVSHKPGFQGYIRLSRSGKCIAIHRLVWEQYHGPIPDEMCILHSCDNPPCVEITHLFMGTRDDNMKDRNKKERQARGERHGFSKLKERDIPQIRRLINEGMLHKNIAKIFDVSRRTISCVKTGVTWSWLIG